MVEQEDGTIAFRNRFSGWWGHRLEDRFLMDPEFIPVPGAYGFRLSNPPVVCVACVRASLDVYEKVCVYLRYVVYIYSVELNIYT